MFGKLNVCIGSRGVYFECDNKDFIKIRAIFVILFFFWSDYMLLNGFRQKT